ncbi:hypothetical protein [Laceyella putida]|uniref:Uncharacterized protein n=1 Tax=Laceyella putida TaxID=110101 RepID=A0ABW2RRL6_9BACL
MTPVELRQRIDGYFWRLDQERQFLAHLAAALIQPHTKKRIKGTDLYKPLSFKKGSTEPKENRLKKFEEVAKRLAKKETERSEGNGGKTG